MTPPIIDLEVLNRISKKHTLFFAPVKAAYSSACNDDFIVLTDAFVKSCNTKNITNVIASSDNALIALLLCFGYTAQEMSNKIDDLNLNIDKLLLWVQKQLTEKLGSPLATFEDLKKKVVANTAFKDLHLVVLNIETNKLEILNYKNTPDLPIVTAIRICMSFSMQFPIIEINDSSINKKSSYVDGGIVLQHLGFKQAVNFI